MDQGTITLCEYHSNYPRIYQFVGLQLWISASFPCADCDRLFVHLRKLSRVYKLSQVDAIARLTKQSGEDQLNYKGS